MTALTPRRIKYRRLRLYKYQLTETYRHPLPLDAGLVLLDPLASTSPFVAIDGFDLVLRKGYAWDGPSGPTIDTEASLRGSLVHDGLYQLIRAGVLAPESRAYADRVMREVYLQDGLFAPRAWIWWGVCRLFGGFAIRPTDPGFEEPLR